MKFPRNTEDMREILASDEGRTLIAEIRENHRRLDSCPRHTFNPPEELRLRTKLTCVHCLGEMGLHDAGLYVKGYRAAGGNVEDVWPGHGTQKMVPL